MKTVHIGLLILLLGVALSVWFLSNNDTMVAPVFVGDIHTFYCPGDFVFTTEYTDGAEFARVSLSGVQYTLKRAPSGSGSRYVGTDSETEFWEHQDEVRLLLPGMTEATTCSVDPLPPEPEFIEIAEPEPWASVGNPLSLSGRARGYWFFEASAPVVVVDWDGRIIGEGLITAEGEWMTEDFVPFRGEVTYNLPVDSYSASGTVIFRRDNPSGLPENDMAVEVPVVLER